MTGTRDRRHTLSGESPVDFDDDRSADPSFDPRIAEQAEFANGPLQAPAPAPQPTDWPIARGRINDPI